MFHSGLKLPFLAESLARSGEPDALNNNRVLFFFFRIAEIGCIPTCKPALFTTTHRSLIRAYQLINTSDAAYGEFESSVVGVGIPSCYGLNWTALNQVKRFLTFG